MPTRTKIEWCDYVSNPIRALATKKTAGPMARRMGHACVKISAGCQHCWASSMNVRLGTGLEYTAPNMAQVETVLDARELERLEKFQPRGPFKYGRERALVFLNDMTDMFGNWVDLDIWVKIFKVILFRKDISFMILTKRPARMANFLIGTPAINNVILGTSIENQDCADERLYALEYLARAGWSTAVSYEPALGQVDWYGWEFLDWMICGGESGSQARPMRSEWARAARDFSNRNAIPFFFKQWGEWVPLDHFPWITDATTFKWRPVDGMVKVGRGMAGHVLDGREWRQCP
jgi:protein gp37